jgi:hypothetical protein
MNNTTFPQGGVLTSTAFTPDGMDGIFQLLTTQMLGIAANTQIVAQLATGSNVIVTPLTVLNIFAGFFVVGIGIPANTTITGMSGQGTNLLIELSNNATLSGEYTLGIYDPVANTRVRLSWQTEGAPAFTIDDDVLFIRCAEEESDYNVRDETWSTGDSQAIQTRVYSRLWNVFFRARGPNSFDTIRLIKSMLLQDFPHDTLAALNLYMVTATSTPVRAPELFDGRWWEQVDYNADFFEQVTETYTITTVDSVEIIGYTKDGQKFDIKPTIL